MIRTPDQRVRVFVSSTLQELAVERLAVKQAIEKLRLIPVLFELSARHHPPQDLYRDYLNQSDVFIGIYWQKYGWVAPDMTISGLEDEYRIARQKPKLIYVKQAQDREPRLKELLGDIQSSNALCYRPFSSAEELLELVENDLAIMLSEHFQSPNTDNSPVSYYKFEIPTIADKVIGRDKDIEQLRSMLASDQYRLITICGAGGTGKTRLAIETAQQLKNHYSNGIIFIGLEAITDPDLVPAAIIHLLPIMDSGKQAVSETLLSWLSDKQMLLVLDNMEQVTASSHFIGELIQRCPACDVLVTSRTPLHLRYEQIYPLEPLPTPADLSTEMLPTNPAFQLFIQRVREVNPYTVFGVEDQLAIQKICTQLDGLPLAIELAALRTRYINPSMMIKMIHSSLDLAGQGPVNLPNRQKTLRNTIEWSVQLMSEDERSFFYSLAIYHGGWTLDAVSILQADFLDRINPMDVLERMIDLGLIYRKFSSVQLRYDWLKTIREYATEGVNNAGDPSEKLRSYYQYYADLTQEYDPLLRGLSDSSYVQVINEEFENIRAAFNLAIQFEDWRTAWKFPGALSMYWLSVGKISEALEWMDRANIRIDYPINHLPPGDQALFGRAIQIKGLIRYLSGRFDQAIKELQISIEAFIALQDLRGQAIGYAYAGLSGLSINHPDTEKWFLRANELGQTSSERFSQILAKTFLAEHRLSMNDPTEAFQLLDEAEALCRQGYEMYLSLTFVVKAATLLALGQPEKALPYYEESLLRYNQSSFKAANGWALVGAAFCHLWMNDQSRAIDYFREAIENGRNSGDVVMILVPAMGLGIIQAQQGETQKGIALYLEAYKTFQAAEYKPWRVIQTTIQKLNELLKGYSVDKTDDPPSAPGIDQLFQLAMQIHA